MKKKLLDILFGEEEKEEYYEEVYEDEIMAEPKPLKQPMKPIQADVVKESRKYIETPAAEVKPEVVGKRALNPEENTVATPEPRRISLDIDDLEEKIVSKTSPVKPAVSPMRKNKLEYEFSPVISPMFGADEKDKEMVVPKILKKNNFTKSGVLSPIHGFSEVEKEAPLPTRVLGKESSNNQEERAESELVNLTLDEILARTASLSAKNQEESEVARSYEEKKVVNSRNMSLFDEE